MSQMKETFEEEVRPLMHDVPNETIDKMYKEMSKHPLVGGIMRFPMGVDPDRNRFHGYSVISPPNMSYETLLPYFYNQYDDDEGISKRLFKTVRFDNVTVHVHVIEFLDDVYTHRRAGTMDFALFLDEYK